MQPDELTALISQTAMLMEQFERRCENIDQRLQGLAGDMQRLVVQLPAVVGQSVDGSLQALPNQVLSQVRDGMARPVGDYQQRLHAAGIDIEGSAQTLTRQIRRTEQLHQWLIWKVVAATTACLVLLLAGGAWLLLHYTRVIRENQLSAELLKAYNAADVTLCEHGRLCANVDAKGTRHGDRKQYLPVLPR